MRALVLRTPGSIPRPVPALTVPRARGRARAAAVGEGPCAGSHAAPQSLPQLLITSPWDEDVLRLTKAANCPHDESNKTKQKAYGAIKKARESDRDMYLSETDGRIHHDFALKRTFPEMPKKIFEKQDFHLFILQSSEPRDAINQDGAVRRITATSQQTQSSLNSQRFKFTRRARFPGVKSNLHF